MRFSEVYRGRTIHYDRAARRWLVAVPPGDRLIPFTSAFEARRAVNVALDGHSVSRPRREG